MVGALLFSSLLIGTTLHYCRNHAIDRYNRTHNRIEGTDDLYRDHNMVARNIYTNEPFICSHGEGGDLCCYDEGMNLVKNYTQIQQKKAFENSTEVGKFFLVDSSWHKKDKVVGQRYARVGSDHLYVKRKVYFPSEKIFELYYMDVETLELVCPINGKEDTPRDRWIKKLWRKKMNYQWTWWNNGSY